jgi:hypothetical protein
MKLEKGTKVTTWSENATDITTYVNSYTQNNILTQNTIFNTLTNNGNTQGIWLQAGKFYINASVLGTSILRSNNFTGNVTSKGSIKIKNENGKYVVIKNSDKTIDFISSDNDANVTYLTMPSYTVSWGDNSRQGTLWDLNSGKIWAANFDLRAENTLSGITSKLFLNSSPASGEDYLYIGNDNQYIQFTRAGELNLKVNSFELIGTVANNLLKNTEPREDNGEALSIWKAFSGGSNSFSATGYTITGGTHTIRLVVSSNGTNATPMSKTIS